jgi:hypothetical protein
VECDNDHDSYHVRIYQMLDRLEEGIDFLPIGDDGTIALALRCFSEETTGVRRQGRIGVAPEVEPPLVPPLVRR